MGLDGKDGVHGVVSDGSDHAFVVKRVQDLLGRRLHRPRRLPLLGLVIRLELARLARPRAALFVGNGHATQEPG